MMDGCIYDALWCAVKPNFWNLSHENSQVHQPHMRESGGFHRICGWCGCEFSWDKFQKLGFTAHHSASYIHPSIIWWRIFFFLFWWRIHGLRFDGSAVSRNSMPSTCCRRHVKALANLLMRPLNQVKHNVNGKLTASCTICKHDSGKFLDRTVTKTVVDIIQYSGTGTRYRSRPPPYILLSRAVLLEVIAIVVLLLYWSRAFNLEYSIYNNKIRKEIYN